MKQYLELLKTILDKGVKKSDRTGTGTISISGYQLRCDLQDGFPLLTTKRVYWKGIITELLWFLRGETHIRSLIENKVNIWNGNAYDYYKKRYDNPVSYEEFLRHLTPIKDHRPS